MSIGHRNTQNSTEKCGDSLEPEKFLCVSVDFCGRYFKVNHYRNSSFEHEARSE